MPTDDNKADKPTDDASTIPFIEVDVPRETARKALQLADEDEITIEDALARLTVYDYPADVLCEPAAGQAAGDSR